MNYVFLKCLLYVQGPHSQSWKKNPHCLQNKSHFIVKTSLIEFKDFYKKIPFSMKVLQFILKTLIVFCNYTWNSVVFLLSELPVLA